MPPLRGAVAALLAAMAVASPALASSKIPALDKKWLWVSDERFEVLTNGPEYKARELIVQLEIFRSTIAKLSGGSVAEPARPTRVLLFAHVWDMRPYQMLDAQGKPETFAGYFHGNGETNYIVLYDEDRDELPRVALASYAAFLIALPLGELPTWVRIGLAQYFSAFRYLKREQRAEIGRPIPEYLGYLNQSPHAPLESILAMTYDSPEFARDVPRNLFFAKSWLLVHYLQLGSPERAGALARFAQNRAQGMADIEALEKAAGSPLRQLDDELDVYQKRSLMPLVALDVAKESPAVGASSRPATREDVAYRLGEYLHVLGAERRSEALAHFAAAGKPEPADQVTIAASPLQFIPRIAPAARDERSISGLRSAIERGDATDRDKALYAERVLELARQDAASAAGDLPLARRALAELVTAEPRNAQWWSMLGRFYREGTEHADLVEARRLFEAGRERAPKVQEIISSLTSILLLLNEVDEAAGVLDDALRSGTLAAPMRRSLELLRNDVAYRQARVLLEAGRGAEGERILDARVAATEDPEVRASAQVQLEGYRRQLEDNDLGARYAAAIDLVNAQKIEQGAEALRAVIRDGPGSQWADLARVDLEKVEAFLARRRARQSPPTPPPASPPL